jgi:spore maturation protein CgeB
MRFIIESSHSAPIYNRIAIAFCIALKEMGHDVLFIDVSDFDRETYIKTINNLDINYYISTNGANLIHAYDPISDSYNFDHIVHKKIFIHHDSAVAGPGTANEIFKKYNALSLVNSSSFHFCIERSTISELKKVGITNAFLITHASEFFGYKNENNSLDLNVSFIGHLTSDFSTYPINQVNLSHHLLGHIYKRISKSSYSIQPEIRALCEKNEIQRMLNCLAYGSSVAYQILMHEITKLSLPYRAEIFKILNPIPIAIIGGDLSNGTSSHDIYRMSDSHINYYAATANYNQASEIYSNSRVNINLSSLQFDTGINNRIIDVVASGGFLLTDLRSDLLEIIPETREISFETPEELKEKIYFYLDSSNNSRYFEIREHLNKEFASKFNYYKTVETILTLTEPPLG